MLRAIPLHREGWRAAAACRGLDPALFHSAADDDIDAARAVCARCPVRLPCLEDALEAREPHGVWGGLSERDRRRLLRQRRRSA